MNQPTDKFIAYVDIVGFKSLVHEAERGLSISSSSELSDAVAALGTEEDRKEFEKHGPLICPDSSAHSAGLGFSDYTSFRLYNCFNGSISGWADQFVVSLLT